MSAIRTMLVGVTSVAFCSRSITLMRKLSPCKVGLALVRVRVRVPMESFAAHLVTDNERAGELAICKDGVPGEAVGRDDLVDDGQVGDGADRTPGASKQPKETQGNACTKSHVRHAGAARERV